MRKSEGSDEKGRRRFCPYCEEELAVPPPPYCQPCGMTLRYCTKCQVAVVRAAAVCPQCGGELDWK